MLAHYSIHFHIIFFYISSFSSFPVSFNGSVFANRFFSQKLWDFLSEVMRFWIRNLLNRDCASAPIFLVVTLYFYLNGERNTKQFQAVYMSVRTILAISTCDGRTLPRTETLYFLAATLHFTWMVKEYKAVSSGVRVSQHLFLSETTLFLCETNPVSKWNNTVSMWNSPASFVDNPVSMWTALYLCGNPVSMWTAPFSFSILQNRFCVDGFVSVNTRGSI